MNGFPLIIALLGLAVGSTVVDADSLPATAPEMVGMSSERLVHLTKILKDEVESRRLPGAVLAISRKGKLVYFESVGFLHAQAKTPMPRDAIFSIASMTKPMVSVAAMILHDEGRLLLSDPVAKYLPALADMRVVAPETDDVATSTLKADRQPTIHDLLTHMSGFSYAGNRTEAHKKWPASSATAARTYTGSEFIDIMSEAPLLHQPGALWDYSLSVDVLGLVIETVAGTSLGHFMDERLWKPLGMVDTAFAVPTAKRSRYAQPLPNDPLTGADQSMLHQSKEPLKFECGGGCAVSTAMDYLRFAQMLANKGSLDGHRILLRKTVELMTSDQIAHDVRERSSYSILAQGHSFGLGLAVRTHSAPTALAGSVGDFGWGGASGTYFWVDPQEELAVVFMAATPSEIRNHFRALVRNLVLASIMD